MHAMHDGLFGGWLPIVVSIIPYAWWALSFIFDCSDHSTLNHVVWFVSFALEIQLMNHYLLSLFQHFLFI